MGDFDKNEGRLEDLEHSVNSLKDALIRQNNLILKLGERIMELLNSQKDLEKRFFNVSTGNKGVNQSINNQSTNTNQINDRIASILREEAINNVSTGNKGVQEPLAQGLNIEDSPENDVLERNLKDLTIIQKSINEVFRTLSKQELKTFLTIYQLQEEGLNPTYKAISKKMNLSEHCIRAHVCTLFKKKAPLEKSKLNNRLTLIFVKKSFKSLNLKPKILNLYYKLDPNQTTLL